MEIKQNFYSNDITILIVQNRYIDASNVKDFRNAMRTALGNTKHFAVDMSAVEFIDSAGIGALISCLRDVNSKGGSIELFSLTSGVLALFEIMRLNKIFQLHLDRQTALNALRS